MSEKPVIIVGSGMGGLSAAITLSARNLPVRVFDAAPRPGGKIRKIAAGAHHVDSGPTVLTMRDVFEGIFSDADAGLDSYVATLPLPVLARHTWDGDSTLDLFTDLDRSIDAVGDFAGLAEARRYRRFCGQVADTYRALNMPFMRSQRPNPVSLVTRSGIAGLPALARIKPFTSMWGELSRIFQDPRLRQLFGRYATYCGSSPFLAPSVLMLVAHVEQSGVWSVEGGMSGLAEGCRRLAADRGCRFHFEQAIRSIETNRDGVTGVTTAEGEFHAASAVIFNGDPGALATGLLGESVRRAVKRRSAATPSLSALTLSASGVASGFELDRHNVFFSSDYAAEFDDLFVHQRLPLEPTVYVCAQNRGVETDILTHPAPAAEPLFCLVNAPAIAGQRPLNPGEIERCQNQILGRLRRCGLKLEVAPTALKTTTPTDFSGMFPATGGALYGQASHHWSASFSRPRAVTRIKGLYLVGGATHPGPGVPMAAISGQLAVSKLLQHRGLISP